MAAQRAATENLLRDDLTVGDEGRMYQQLKQLLPPASSKERDADGRLSNRGLARRLGISVNRVDRATRLLRHPMVLEQVEAGTLTLREALAQIGEVHHGDALVESVTPERVDRQTMEAQVHHGDAVAAPFFKPVRRFAQYVQKLQPQDVPAGERAQLREELEAVITAAQLALRALDEAREQA